MQKVLIHCPNWVGDVVMATPVFDCIRHNFPQAAIAGLIRTYAYGVIKDGPWFDEVICAQDKTLRGFCRAVQEVRGFKPDLAFVFSHSQRSVLIAWLGGAREIVGFKGNGLSWLVHKGPEKAGARCGQSIIPMVESYMDLCCALNLDVNVDPKPQLFFSPQDQAWAEHYLAALGLESQDRVIGMNPGARFGSSKCWPPEHFARLAELLEDRTGCRVLLLAGPGERELSERICRLSSARILNTGLEPVDLHLLKPMIKRCEVLISNDTGPRHYAVAMGVPVVVIMGPTNPAYTNANLENQTVVRRDLDCAPCHLKVCPRDHECMTSIPPEEVFQETLKHLSSRLQ
jgi:heptosyltransferase-2